MLIPTSRAQPNPTRPAPPHQTTPHRGANTTKPHPTARASERKSTHSDHPPDQFSSSGSLPLLGFQSGLLLQSRFPLLAGIEAQRFLLASKHSDSSCWRRSTASSRAAGLASSSSTFRACSLASRNFSFAASSFADPSCCRRACCCRLAYPGGKASPSFAASGARDVVSAQATSIQQKVANVQDPHQVMGGRQPFPIDFPLMIRDGFPVLVEGCCSVRLLCHLQVQLI